jgi:Uma2 family endonuclease
MARTEATLTLPRPGERVSYEEFLDRYAADFAEWVDGEVIFMAPVTRRHAEISDFLLTLLRLYVKRYGLGTVLSAPYQMRLEGQRSGREPDLLFVAREREHLLLRTRLAGPADLAVEVVSEESVERDRVVKFREYAAAGVREYWLIDPETETAEFFGLVSRAGETRYEPLPVEEGAFSSAVIEGFRLRVEWLWQSPPDEWAALSALGLLG